jgi:hypothetical protein
MDIADLGKDLASVKPTMTLTKAEIAGLRIK